MPVSAVWFDFENTRHGVITLDGVTLLGESELDGIVLAHAWHLLGRPMLSYVFVGGSRDLSNLYEAHGEMEVGYDEKLLLIDIEREITTTTYRRPAFRRCGLVRGGMISVPPGFDADRYGAEAEAQEKCDELLRKLDRAGLARYRRRFDPESLAIMGRLGEPDKRIYAWLAEQSVAGARRREFARTFPMLMPAVWAFTGAEECRKAIDDGVSLLPSLNALIQGGDRQPGQYRVTSGHLRALRRSDWGIERDASSFQQMLPHIPPNKIPIDRESVRACEKMSLLWGAANTAIAGRSYQTLLNGLDQNWAGSLDLMRSEFGRRLDRVDAAWLFDPADHFFTHVLVPAIALAHPEPPTWLGSALDTLSAKLVYRDLNIAGMIRQSDRWHRAILMAVDEPATWLSWDRLFTSYVCEKTGLAITCLGSSSELIDEGSPGKDAEGFHGLSHCVGSYNMKCASYECAILSIREQDNGSKGRRVSTVELGVNADGKLTVVQHAAFDNLAPSEAAETALAGYLEAISAGEIMGEVSRLRLTGPTVHGAGEAAQVAARIPTVDRQRREEAWALWRPLLARDFRSMSLDDFATWLANHPSLRIQAAA